MATTKRTAPRSDAKKGQARYIDQPGQWRNTTPASVRKKQQKEWAKLEKMMEKPKKSGKK